jgi:hypothetical protein
MERPRPDLGCSATDEGDDDDEHIQAICNTKESSGYAQHILTTVHTYRTIDDTMQS